MILVAILLPPVAVLLCGKPVQALINIPLTLCLWLPGVIHALIVVSNHNADRRHKEMLAVAKSQAAPAPPDSRR